MAPETLPCALTFDDGPDDRWTPAVLNQLRLDGTPATFFVMAERAQRNPALVSRMLEDGHQVALHCDRHVRHTDLREAELRADTHRALTALDRLGVRASHWRAPWGICTAATRRVADEHQLELVGWDLDSHDWRGDRAPEMHCRIGPSLRPGSVVLMHDGLGPGALRSGCAETVRLTALLIRTLREAGLRAGRVGEVSGAAERRTAPRVR